MIVRLYTAAVVLQCVCHIEAGCVTTADSGAPEHRQSLGGSNACMIIAMVLQSTSTRPSTASLHESCLSPQCSSHETLSVLCRKCTGRVYTQYICKQYTHISVAFLDSSAIQRPSWHCCDSNLGLQASRLYGSRLSSHKRSPTIWASTIWASTIRSHFGSRQS